MISPGTDKEDIYHSRVFREVVEELAGPWNSAAVRAVATGGLYDLRRVTLTFAE